MYAAARNGREHIPTVSSTTLITMAEKNRKPHLNMGLNSSAPENHRLNCTEHIDGHKILDAGPIVKGFPAEPVICLM
jgi:hypothetical protein